MNKVTGDSQWEYPSDESGADVKEDASSVETPVQSSAAAVTSNPSLGVWSYPGKNCLLEVAHSSFTAFASTSSLRNRFYHFVAVDALPMACAVSRILNYQV